MNWSIKIAKAFGIPVLIHWSFWLLIVFVLFQGFSEGVEISYIAITLLLVMVVFLCVVLHEFGHALTARRFGVKTRDIILTPIGGIARLERLPENAFQEFLVALAGPMVNVIIAFTLGLVLWIGTDASLFGLVISPPYDSILDFFVFVFKLNIALVLFNILPAFPMDGGRMLRALLSLKLSRLKATRIATLIGQGIAVLFVAFGLINGQIFLAFIGLFVFLMAGAENRMVRMDSLLQSISISEIVRKPYTVFWPGDTMEDTIHELKKGLEKQFLVMDYHNRVQGVLHEAFIIEAINKEEQHAPVEFYLSTNFEPIQLTMNIKDLYWKMQSKGYSILPVYDEDMLVGVVDIDGINHFLKLQQKTNKRKLY